MDVQEMWQQVQSRASAAKRAQAAADLINGFLAVLLSTNIQLAGKLSSTQ